MTVTADTQDNARVIEFTGPCVACMSTAGAVWGCCTVCGCPTQQWQQRMAGARALTFGATGRGTRANGPQKHGARSYGQQT